MVLLSLVPGCGTVFKISAGGERDNRAQLFRRPNGGRGRLYYVDLILDPAGNPYGTTVGSGDLTCSGHGGGCGVVFKVDPTGKENGPACVRWGF
jgi:hypothetical protein